jgi:hypothetical protein
VFQHSTKNYLHVLCKFTEVREYTWLLLKDMAWTLKFLASDCGFWDLKSCKLLACCLSTSYFLVLVVPEDSLPYLQKPAPETHREPVESTVYSILLTSVLISCPITASSSLRFRKRMWGSVLAVTFNLALLCHPVRHDLSYRFLWLKGLFVACLSITVVEISKLRDRSWKKNYYTQVI